jgi:hypothetical protein
MLKLIAALSIAVCVAGCSTSTAAPAKAAAAPAKASAPADFEAWGALVDDASRVSNGCELEYGDVTMIEKAKTALAKQNALASELNGFLSADEGAGVGDGAGNAGARSLAADLERATVAARVACTRVADDVRASRDAVQD